MMFLFTTNLICSVGVPFKQAVGISMGIDSVPLDLVQNRIIHEKQNEEHINNFIIYIIQFDCIFT